MAEAKTSVRRYLPASGLLLFMSLADAAPPTSIRPTQLDNWFAYIPPACYVDTKGPDDSIHNPCYVCHQKGLAPNFIDDSDLQLEYSFPAPARINYWSNLWKDRRPAMAKISDQTITAYVQTDNYKKGGKIVIADAFKQRLPEEWDSNGNGIWEGLIPDVYYNLDADGFDRDPQGNYTGWRQYQYAPLPGNFSPVNGSVGDGFIRMGEEFRVDERGRPDQRVYKLNLAIIESAITRRDIEVAEFDERDYGVDLDNSGELSRADTIAYNGEPGSMKLIGRAGVLQGHNRIHLETGLFPESTEFFHSLRYLDISKAGEVTQAPRVKEIRYAIKKRWYPPAMLDRFAADETKEKAYTPDRPRWVRGNQEFGVSNALGWQYRGFIEDGDGDLRPQTHEELVFCVGCHSGIGATTDSNFSFVRKLGDDEAGYLSGITVYAGGRAPRATSEQSLSPELDAVLKGYAAYFEHNGSLNDFRNLSADISGPLTAQRLRSLFWPSAGNAMLLNKAYRTIVQEQSYARGRDAVTAPLAHVLRKVEKGAETGVTTPVKQP